MAQQLKKRKRVLLFMFCDIVCIIASGFFSLFVRFEFMVREIPVEFLDNFIKYLPIHILAVLLIYYMLRLYHSVWELVGINEAVNLCIGTVASTYVQYIGMSLLGLMMPRSVFLIDGLLRLVLAMGVRFSYRIARLRWRHRSRSAGSANTMVIGAGAAGQMILYELRKNGKLNGKNSCIIDDNLDKYGKYIYGIPVVGTRDDIQKNVLKYKIQQIILAIPSISNQGKKEILEICQHTGCELKIMPGLYEMLERNVSPHELRRVSLEDLLGRDPIVVQDDNVGKYVGGKTVLVTGGGGSIGSELCRQLAGYAPECLIIFDIYENNAYEIQQELLRNFPGLHLEVLIGSVRDRDRLEQVFSRYRPELVFHAAAHKHVPLMEDSPGEAIKNNIFGTLNTAETAAYYGAERFVLISTDKAVNPTNVMGATKRACEMLIQALDKRYDGTEFVSVRFGNVLGSNGSVIPLFEKQIAEGGPVTVTHPEMTRFFMTIPEAVSLVLQAGAYAKGGEIFILDMGEPVKIFDVACKLIRLSGYVPGEDIEIKHIGLRPGEKLHEEILMDEEGLQETENALIHIGRPISMDEEDFFQKLDRMRWTSDDDELMNLLAELVPTYMSPAARVHRLLTISPAVPAL